MGRAHALAYSDYNIVNIFSWGGASALSNSGGGSWLYSNDITINNPGGALSDYQVIVNLTGSAFPTGANTSGADVRFEKDGTELAYWVEEWNYSAMKGLVWVNVSSIPAGESTMRMWYGNPSAGSVSNGTRTFEFFDDFNGPGFKSPMKEITYSAWTPENTNYGGGTYNIDSANSELDLIGQDTAVGLITNTQPIVDWVAELKINSIRTTCCTGMPFFIATLGDTDNNIVYFHQHDPSVPYFRVVKRVNDNESNLYYIVDSSHSISNKFYKMSKYGQNFSFYESTNGISWTNLYTGIFSEYNANSAWYFAFLSGLNEDVSYDYLRIRKFASPEPTVTVGAEQSAYIVEYNFIDNIDKAIIYDDSGNTYIYNSSNNTINQYLTNWEITGEKGWVSNATVFVAGKPTWDASKQVIVTHPFLSTGKVTGEYSFLPLQYANLTGYYANGGGYGGGGCGDGVRYNIELENNMGEKITLINSVVTDYRNWHKISVNVSSYVGKNIKIRFIVDGRSDQNCDQSVWGDIKLTGYSGSTPTIPAISVSPSPATVITLGSTQQFTATDQDGNPISVDWSSSDESVGTVSPASGTSTNFTALKAGAATVTGTKDGVVGSVSVDVVAGQTFTNSIGMEFAQIPAGEFEMGSPSNEAGRWDAEGPVHHVKISNAFYIGKYEVTQKQWRDVMGTSPSYFKGDNLPVEMVSWNDAQDFIKKLNEKEGGNKYRLPTEAEWEYAARAGTTTKYSFGDDESMLDDYAWYYSNSGSKTHEVGLKKSNPWGLYDMYGNIWEWAQDIYHNSYNGAPTDGSAWGGNQTNSKNRISTLMNRRNIIKNYRLPI